MILASRLQLLHFVWCCPLSDPTFDKFPEAAADTKKTSQQNCSYVQCKDRLLRCDRPYFGFRFAVFSGLGTYPDYFRFLSAVFGSLSISHGAVSGSWAASVFGLRAPGLSAVLSFVFGFEPCSGFIILDGRPFTSEFRWFCNVFASWMRCWSCFFAEKGGNIV